MNSAFLETIKLSFYKYLKTDPRSNEKLKILHGKIAEDLFCLLNIEGRGQYTIQSLGYGDGKEGKIPGRYMEKKVDIAVSYKGTVIAGVAVKFVMSNYSQNSNNYFETMLGETANIRANNTLYFQILVIPEEMPYYKNDKTISRIEELTEHNISKYLELSKDSAGAYFHIPDKTLLTVISLPKIDTTITKNFEDYKRDYSSVEIGYSHKEFATFGSLLVCNDYAKFMQEITNLIKSKHPWVVLNELTHKSTS